jgi:hypothetical protein
MKKMWPEGATTAAQTSNYTSNASSGGNNYQYVTRIDHDLTDHQHLSGRYTWWDNINLAADPLKNGMCGEGECTEHYRMHNFVLDDTVTMSSKMILDVRLSYGRYGYQRVPLDPWTTQDYADIGWTPQMAALTEFPGPPVFVVPDWDPAGLFSGQGADSTIIDAQDTYRLAGTLTRFVGNHTFKFGAEFTIDKFNYAQTNTSSGLWNFKGSETANSSIGANQVSTSGLDIASYLLGYADNGGSWYSDLIASEVKYPAVFSPTTGVPRKSSPSTLAPVRKPFARSLSVTTELASSTRKQPTTRWPPPACQTFRATMNLQTLLSARAGSVWTLTISNSHPTWEFPIVLLRTQ